MTVLRINAHGDHPMPAHMTASLTQCLTNATRGNGPIIIMVHGFKFSPFVPTSCPHRDIFARSTFEARRRSWPCGLGFGPDDPKEGLCIAFGWHALGGLWRAARHTRHTARALARLIRRLRDLAPARPIHLIAHSLGAGVCLKALPHLKSGDVSRAILLCAAAFRDEARTALKSAAGAACEFLNITSGENRPYDVILKLLIRPHLPASVPLRVGLQGFENWVDIAIDRASTRAHLSRLGLPIGRSEKRMCHWSTYTRKGTFALYARALHAPHLLPLSKLRTPPDARRFWG